METHFQKLKFLFIANNEATGDYVFQIVGGLSYRLVVSEMKRISKNINKERKTYILKKLESSRLPSTPQNCLASYFFVTSATTSVKKVDKC